MAPSYQQLKAKLFLNFSENNYSLFPHWKIFRLKASFAEITKVSKKPQVNGKSVDEAFEPANFCRFRQDFATINRIGDESAIAYTKFNNNQFAQRNQNVTRGNY